MKNIINKHLPANSFARGVAVLSSGTVGAQVLLLITTPILTRLYSPENFGVLAVFVSILNILAVVATLKYELAIPIAEDEETALNIVALCLLVTAGMAIVIGLILWLSGNWITSILNVPKLVAYIWLLPIGLFLIGVYKTFSYWSTRVKAFSRLSKAKLAQSITSLIVQLSCFKLSTIGLILGFILGQIAGASRLAQPSFNQLEVKSILSIPRIKDTAYRYRRFPQISTWDGLLNASSLHFFPILLAAIFGAPMAGLFALANRISHLPITFMSGSIAQVIYTSLAEMSSNEKREFIIQLNQLLSYAITPLTIIFIFYGEEIFSFIFSNKWEGAGEYVRWVAIWAHFQFISSPISNIFLIQEEQVELLLFQVFLFISRISALSICFSLDVEQATYVSSFSLVSAFMYFFLVAWIYKAVNVSKTKIISIFIPVIFCLAILAPIYYKFNLYIMFLIYIPVIVLFFSKVKFHFRRVSHVYIRR